MRKQTKIAALVSAAALLAIGASMTSFAAGWTYDDSIGHWVYKDSDGYNVEYEWKKWTDGRWCYLGEGGVAAADQLVPYNDTMYYVDTEGFRVLSAWKYVDNVDGEDVNGITPDGIWYYFGSDGKAYAGEKKIGDKYYRFDESFHMVSGWYDTTDSNGNPVSYYYNDTVEETNSAYGEALTKWQYMTVRGGVADDQDATEGWYYFSDKGLMYTGDKYFDKKWWHFGTDGVLATGWQEVDPPSVATTNDYAYFDESSAKKKSGWIYVSDKTIGADSGTYWFYVNAYGTPVQAKAGDGYRVKSDGTKEIVAAIRVKGKTYLIDSVGRMLDGVQTLENVKIVQGGTGYLDGLYYFSSDDWSTGGSNGAMVTNTKVTVYDDYDNATDYYFNKSGAAYKDRIVGNAYYDVNGKKKVAEFDNYAPVKVTKGTKVEGKDYAFNQDDIIIVRSNGTVSRSTIVSGIEGFKKAYVGKLPSKSELDKATKGELTIEWQKGFSATSTSASITNPYVVTCYVYSN